MAGSPKKRARRAAEAAKADPASQDSAPPSARAREAKPPAPPPEEKPDDRDLDVIAAENQRRLQLAVNRRLERADELDATELYYLQRIVDGEARRPVPRGARNRPQRIVLVRTDGTSRGDAPASGGEHGKKRKPRR